MCVLKLQSRVYAFGKVLGLGLLASIKVCSGFLTVVVCAIQFFGRSLGAGSMKSELQCCPNWRVVTFRGLGLKGFKV